MVLDSLYNQGQGCYNDLARFGFGSVVCLATGTGPFLLRVPATPDGVSVRDRRTIIRRALQLLVNQVNSGAKCFIDCGVAGLPLVKALGLHDVGILSAGVHQGFVQFFHGLFLLCDLVCYVTACGVGYCLSWRSALALPVHPSPLAFRSCSLAVIIVYYKGTYISIDILHKDKGTYLVIFVSGLIFLTVL